MNNCLQKQKYEIKEATIDDEEEFVINKKVIYIYMGVIVDVPSESSVRGREERSVLQPFRPEYRC